VKPTVEALRSRGVHPSPQRVAIARYVLATSDHPSADEVLERVRKRFPLVSRATVYNTLNLLVAKGLLKQHALTSGRVVFDPNLERHHHFIDIDSGRIVDVPWGAVSVSNVSTLKDFDVVDYQVVMRGRRARTREKEK
jgi:Fe2+ or Zn2+ uptake regulation protein